MAVNITPGTVMPFLEYPNKSVVVPNFEGINATCFPMNFELAGGGMGDYICWTPALQWIVNNCPWVHGRIWAPAYFIEFVRHFFEGVPNWKVDLIEHFKDKAEPGSLVRGLQSTPNQLLNATGANLMQLGFSNFANLNPMPVDTTYPELKLTRPIHKKLRGLERKYVVFTPGGTTQSRFVSAKHWNPLIDFVNSLGLIPVFLGKTQLADIHRSYFDDEINYDRGLDLRESTSLLDAAKIMEEAACTIGLDNGLLHLAACTKAPIIFAYNIASPKDRRPIRKEGKFTELILSKEEMSCIHCQTEIKLLYHHNFKNCIRRDTACIDKLFENGGDRWKKAILEIIQ